MPLGRTMVQSVLQPRQVVTKHSSAKLTYDDYLQFPDDGLRHEIIEGQHYVTPSPSTRHQRIVLRLLYLIENHLQQNPVGELFAAPFDVLLSEYDVLEPDLLFLSLARSPLLTEKNLEGAPDLVVEILSPSTASRDKRLKRDVYERTGVDEYWVVDPDRDVVDVHRRSGEMFAEPVEFGRERILTTPLLPTLEIPLAKVFE
jgi:Uma2 family endonuclease